MIVASAVEAVWIPHTSGTADVQEDYLMESLWLSCGAEGVKVHCTCTCLQLVIHCMKGVCNVICTCKGWGLGSRCASVHVHVGKCTLYCIPSPSQCTCTCTLQPIIKS